MKRFVTSCIGVWLGLQMVAQISSLEDDFITPPESVKTSVYWYWMCGNISTLIPQHYYKYNFLST